MKRLYHKILGIKKEELRIITDRQVKEIYEKKLASLSEISKGEAVGFDEENKHDLEEAYEQLQTEEKRKEYYSYIIKEPAEMLGVDSVKEIPFLSDEQIHHLYKKAAQICEDEKKNMEQAGEDTTLLSYYKDSILELAKKGLQDPEERTRYFMKHVLDPVYVESEVRRIRDLSKKPTSTPIYHFYDEIGRKVEVYSAGELEYIDASDKEEALQLYMIHKQLDSKLSHKTPKPEIECIVTSTDFKERKNEGFIPSLLSDKNIKIARQIAKSRDENADRKSVYIGSIKEVEGKRHILFEIPEFTAVINFNLEKNMEKRTKAEEHRQKEE